MAKRDKPRTCTSTLRSESTNENAKTTALCRNATRDLRVHRPGNAMLWVLLTLASIALVVDLLDGNWPKTISTALIVVGLVALLLARRYHSSRWRMVMLVAFTLAVAAMFGRFAAWQGWM